MFTAELQPTSIDVLNKPSTIEPMDSDDINNEDAQCYDGGTTAESISEEFLNGLTRERTAKDALDDESKFIDNKAIIISIDFRFSSPWIG